MLFCHFVHIRAEYKIRFVADEKGAYSSTAALCFSYAKCVLGIKGNAAEVFRCMQNCLISSQSHCHRTILIDSKNKHLEAFIVFLCQTRRSLDDVQHMLMHLQV